MYDITPGCWKTGHFFGQANNPHGRSTRSLATTRLHGGRRPFQKNGVPKTQTQNQIKAALTGRADWDPDRIAPGQGALDRAGPPIGRTEMGQRDQLLVRTKSAQRRPPLRRLERPVEQVTGAEPKTHVWARVTGAQLEGGLRPCTSACAGFARPHGNASAAGPWPQRQRGIGACSCAERRRSRPFGVWELLSRLLNAPSRSQELASQPGDFQQQPPRLLFMFLRNFHAAAANATARAAPGPAHPALVSSPPPQAACTARPDGTALVQP